MDATKVLIENAILNGRSWCGDTRFDSVQSLHVSMSTTWFATKEKSRPSYLYSGGMWGQEMAFSGSQKMNMNEISVDGGIDYQRQWG